MKYMNFYLKIIIMKKKNKDLKFLGEKKKG